MPSEPRLLVEPVEEVVDDRLRHVRDDAEGALAVAADGHVADGLLAHVARLEEEARPRCWPTSTSARRARAPARSGGPGRSASRPAGASSRRPRARARRRRRSSTTASGASRSRATCSAAARVSGDEKRVGMKKARRISRAFAGALGLGERRPSAGRSSGARSTRTRRLSRPPESATPIVLKHAVLLEVVADAERERVEQLLAERVARPTRAGTVRREEEALVAPARGMRGARGRAVGTSTCTRVTSGGERRRAPPGRRATCVFSVRRRRVRSRSTVTAREALAEALGRRAARGRSARRSRRRRRRGRRCAPTRFT